MLLIWGLYARQIGLVQTIQQVKLKQKTRTHQPQTKVLEFLVAILAGLPHLKDISRAAHPLDQDPLTAEAWGQKAWADYSGVSRTLQHLHDEEVAALVTALDCVSQPFIDQEVVRALEKDCRLVYDADLTGRPISSTSTSYPDAAFGHMGDTVCLGYQAALVSLHSPTFGRLWLANHLHPGDTVSMTEVQALVLAAENRTGQRPRRRTELLASRLAQAKAHLAIAHQTLDESFDKHRDAEGIVKDTVMLLREWQQEVRVLTADYEQQNRQPTSHCQLTRAQQKVTTYTQRLPRCQKAVAVAERRLARCERAYHEAKASVVRLQAHYQQLLADNAANPNPIEAVFRLDGGFASRENIYWLIEMGYEIYTRGRSTTVHDALSAAVTPETTWERVGGNASLTAWANTTVDDYFVYPLDVALANYHTGNSIRRAALLHFGQTEVATDLDGWFHMYNGRQTIEAGIKEGKNVFQMHHLKVRSLQALLLQEHMACFAANFVRFAAHWLASRSEPTTIPTKSVKQMVQVGAHTSAWVCRQGDVWLLRFTEQSCYAGYSLRLGDGVIQLPLPLFKDVHFSHF
jgi:primosomal protein N''